MPRKKRSSFHALSTGLVTLATLALALPAVASPVVPTAFPAVAPVPPAGPWSTSEEVPGYRVKVRFTNQQGAEVDGRTEPECISETACISGAVPGRPEVFVRVVGPKPNGFLWPTLVKFSTSTVEVWIEQLSTGELRYYRLPGASPGSSDLSGLFDRTAFGPA